MKRKPALLRKILYCVSLPILLYFVGSVYISLRIENLIVAANGVPPLENPSPDIISDEYFRRLDYKSGYFPRIKDSGREFSLRTPVFTLYDSKGAKSVYVYSYTAYYEGHSMGSWCIPVWITSEFQDGKWVIIDVHEPA